jgi:hypothetical protein
MSENISMTRIVDLPDTAGAFEQNGLGADMYIPINGHPNPYGIPPPPVGGMAPPQQTQPINAQFNNTMYSANVQPQKTAPQYSQEQFNEMFTQQQRLPQRDIPMNISEHMQDEQTQPNYIPPPKLTSDYIKDYHYSNVLLKLATIFVKTEIEVFDVSTVKSNGTHKRKPPTCVVDGVQ